MGPILRLLFSTCVNPEADVGPMRENGCHVPTSSDWDVPWVLLIRLII